MKKTTLLTSCILTLSAFAQAQSQTDAVAWPAGYDGIMLQGFYWDSYIDTQWSNIEKQADELSKYFSLIWVPNSGNCATSGDVMGYLPVYWFDHNSSFGSESQLRSMIQAFRGRGTGFIADVVINHRNGVSSWCDFPKEAWNGRTWQLSSTDVCAGDDNGATKAQGYTLSTHADTGDDFNGGRDLDHASANVQDNVKGYLSFLKEDLGYAGFRYDMVKGFAASYAGMYNNEVKPQFSVGEYWDSYDNIKKWIDGTRIDGNIQSAAFDFPFKNNVTSCCNNGRNFGSNLYSMKLLAHDADYCRYAVTFVENHDTNKEQNGGNGALTGDTLAANAFMMASPGTPCVFLTHWKARKKEIKQMILARKAAGITNTTAWEQLGRSTGVDDANAASSYYAFRCGNMICSIGADIYAAPADYTLIEKGKAYRYYLANVTEIPWISVPSGCYETAQKVVLTSVTADASAKLVYTLDGTEPTSASSVAGNGTELNIDGSCTLKVGLLKEGKVTAVETRDYDIKPFEKHKVTVYVSTATPWTGSTNYYIWDSSNKEINGGWPGKAIAETKVVDGRTWYCQTFDITSSGYFVNIVASTGTGSPQTVNKTNITRDTFLEISSDMSAGKYSFVDVTDQVTDVEIVKVHAAGNGESKYDLSGRMATMKNKGLIITNGKKIINRQ